MRAFEGDDFDVVLGTEALWLPASVYGGKAFIPGLANAFPEICRKMFDESQNGDYEACKKNAVSRLMRFATSCTWRPSTQLAVYTMLELRGIIQSYPRKPFQPATDEQKRAIGDSLRTMGVM